MLWLLIFADEQSYGNWYWQTDVMPYIYNILLQSCKTWWQVYHKH